MRFASLSGGFVRAKAHPSPRLVSVGVLGQELSLTERRIQQLVDEGVLPRPSRGSYDLDRCCFALIDYYHAKLGMNPPTYQTFLARARSLGDLGK
jgi:hypothetical protein